MISIRNIVGSLLLSAFGFGHLAAQPTTILEIDTENVVSYASDLFDASKFATDPNLTTAAPVRNFRFVIAVGDVVAVNGKPAKGNLIARQQSIVLSPTPSPGQAVADVSRTAVTEFLFEIQQADGRPVGNVHTLTLSGGAAPVGFSGTAASLGAPLEGSHVIVGGTGAFLGMRGQGASVVLPGNTGPRVASMTEDPAGRRIHGGGKVHFVYQLIPMARPEVIATANGPAITHSADFSLVSTANPGRPGETLSLWAIGLGPTVPAVNLGDPFPANPLSAVNSPLELTVNGEPAEVIAAVGYPGSTNSYQVNFRIPADAMRGIGMIQLSAAWIKGPAVQIPIQ